MTPLIYVLLVGLPIVGFTFGLLYKRLDRAEIESKAFAAGLAAGEAAASKPVVPFNEELEDKEDPEC